jgi:hypothetical protein
MILVSLIYIFLAKKLLRLCAALTGFQAIGGAVFVIMIALPPANPKILTLNSLVYVPLGCSAVGLIFFGYFTALSVYVISFSAFSEIWSQIFFFIHRYDLIHLLIWPSIFMGLIGLYIGHLYKNRMTVICSAYIGSQLFMQGIAFIAQVDYFIKLTDSNAYHFTKRIFWSMFVGSIILTAIGSIFQFNYFTRLDCPRRSVKTPEEYLNI